MSTAATRARLIVNPGAPGPWNMALDEALLESAACGAPGELILRLYTWEPATLSLGYFQQAAARARHAASAQMPVVRRQSGGGAIVHDQELTYSICVPHGHPLAMNVQGLYDALHETLVDALAVWNVASALNAACAGCEKNESEFLCFHRRAVGDVLCQGAKIAGSAQRRRRGAVLQHGSILLKSSIFAPELPGIEELTGVRIEPAELVDAWLQRLKNRLNTAWEPSAALPTERQAAEQLARCKYGESDWTLRR